MPPTLPPRDAPEEEGKIRRVLQRPANGRPRRGTKCSRRRSLPCRRRACRTRSTVKLPVAPAKRPVPTVIVAVSVTWRTPGTPVGAARSGKSAVSVSPLAAVISYSRTRRRGAVEPQFRRTTTVRRDGSRTLISSSEKIDGTGRFRTAVCRRGSAGVAPAATTRFAGAPAPGVAAASGAPCPRFLLGKCGCRERSVRPLAATVNSAPPRCASSGANYSIVCGSPGGTARHLVAAQLIPDVAST